jgi:hypothetical protein
MSLKSFFAAAVIIAALPVSTAHAGAHPPATLTLVIDGTAGPVLKGSDPLGLNGQSATITGMVSESLKPKKHSKTAATYKIPAGAITVTFNGSSYQTTSPSTMTVKLGKSADTLTFVSAVTQEGITVDIKAVASLATGSWNNAVLSHPMPFAPSPQTLSSPSSTITYAGGPFGSTTLGVSGTASNSDAEDPQLPDADE